MKLLRQLFVRTFSGQHFYEILGLGRRGPITAGRAPFGIRITTLITFAHFKIRVATLIALAPFGIRVATLIAFDPFWD